MKKVQVESEYYVDGPAFCTIYNSLFSFLFVSMVLLLLYIQMYKVKHNENK